MEGRRVDTPEAALAEALRLGEAVVVVATAVVVGAAVVALFICVANPHPVDPEADGAPRLRAPRHLANERARAPRPPRSVVLYVCISSFPMRSFFQFLFD